jgi:hypothetical protein
VDISNRFADTLVMTDIEIGSVTINPEIQVVRLEMPNRFPMYGTKPCCRG